ncbi:TIGR01440 family protein [Azotosporobacter soli]|uniref:TIGR01440 family protein n=1 Tax=Azotosporobacter soli TaxID=3055040 RepID=UPI0031FE4C30
MEFRQEIADETSRAIDELLRLSEIKPGQIVVIGCSTSEVCGERIGSAGSSEVAAALLDALLAAGKTAGVYLAIQCCEHLNRALVVEKAAAERYGLDEVCVLPVRQAGGALAACAMQRYEAPVVVEAIEAHAGLDIGQTLIGMHLKRVAVPLRLEQKSIGQAALTAAKTRAKLIGGPRAVYP